MTVNARPEVEDEDRFTRVDVKLDIDHMTGGQATGVNIAHVEYLLMPTVDQQI